MKIPRRYIPIGGRFAAGWVAGFSGIRNQLLILNWLKLKKSIFNGVVEGVNNKTKVMTRKFYSFTAVHCREIALYRSLRRLPVPEMLHRFYWRSKIFLSER